MRSSILKQDRAAKRKRKTMEISRNGSRPSGKGLAEHFTGAVRFDMPLQPSARVAGAHVTLWNTSATSNTKAVERTDHQFL
jgi:hypothetical protein